jgi:hypothetical protein
VEPVGLVVVLGSFVTQQYSSFGLKYEDMQSVYKHLLMRYYCYKIINLNAVLWN